MRKFYLSILFIIIPWFCKAQMYKADEMYIHFFSPAPIANIEAISNAASAKLNQDKNEVFIEIDIATFKFKKALMQTHFNEKYMETKRYPKATFKGKFKDKINLETDGEYQVVIDGKFNIHGVDRNQNVACTFTVKDRKIVFNTKFKLLSADFKIKSPDIIYRKVGQEIVIDATGILVRM